MIYTQVNSLAGFWRRRTASAFEAACIAQLFQLCCFDVGFASSNSRRLLAKIATIAWFLLLSVSGFATEELEPLGVSPPDILASFSSDLVGGVISPLSGQPVMRQIDMRVAGAQEIILSRVYLSVAIPAQFPKYKKDQAEYDKKHLAHSLRENYRGWQSHPHLRLSLSRHYNRLRVSEESGMTLDFSLRHGQWVLQGGFYGISNLCGDHVSGKNDPRNTQFFFPEGNCVIVRSPEGTERHYVRSPYYSNDWLHFFLHKEVLPNGKIVKYTYDHAYQLISIESMDPKERYVYAALHISGAAYPPANHVHFRASSGLEADYHFEPRYVGWKLKDAIKKGKHKIGKHKEQFNLLAAELLTAVSSPQFRQESATYSFNCLLGSYSGKNESFTPIYAPCGEGESSHFRVHKLLLPGEGEAQEAFELNYKLPALGRMGGHTVVKRSDGSVTIYHISPQFLLHFIEYYTKEGTLARAKHFFWNEKQWLEAVEIRDEQQHVLARTSYEYDRFGNPIVEKFSGEGSPEAFVTRRVFSEEGKHLLLKEEDSSGKSISFAYLPGTNLPISKLIQAGDQVLLRQFWVYDDCHNLVQEILDDGSGERSSTIYTLRQEPPFLHMPEWVERRYGPETDEKSLGKSHYIYDAHGNVATEEVYDAAGVFAYALHKTYNERGDLLSETNPLGQRATYAFDARGRKSEEIPFSRRLTRTTSYDARGRVVQKREEGENGQTHSTNYSYDSSDHCVRSIDHFGNTTSYEYDGVADKPIQTIYPPIPLEVGYQPVVTDASYDALGRETLHIDPRGNIVTTSYNAYGNPTEKKHPCGGRTNYSYFNNGWLESETDPDGLTTSYTRDLLGRVTSKRLSYDNKVVATETFTYNAFHLLSQTDRSGYTTTYTYDEAGRKIAEEREGRKKSFAYDTLGRVSTIFQEGLSIHYERDLLGRVVQEIAKDNSKNVLQKIEKRYDAAGHCCAVTHFVHNQPSTQQFEYDPFGRLVKRVDPLGFITSHTYDETDKGVRVTKTDPKGMTILSTHDAYGRVVRLEKKDNLGRPLGFIAKKYDPSGNLIEESRERQQTGFTYDPEHRITSRILAQGTKEEQVEEYSYTLGGKRKTTTRPDGTILYKSYDPLGYLTSCTSSDGMINNHFVYDDLGHVTLAYNSEYKIERAYDPFGNRVQEKINDKVVLRKEYDAFDRTLLLELPDNSSIAYAYDPLFLRKISRINSEGKELYTHTFDAYDLAGNLLSENRIFDLGVITHFYDLKGREEKLESSHLHQSCFYDACDRLLSSSRDDHLSHYTYDTLSQLIAEPGISYKFDTHHNRLRKNEETSHYNSLNQSLSCIHDLNGNLIHRPKDTLLFTFNPLNQLTSAIDKQSLITLHYDPFGRLLHKSSNHGSDEYYFYDGEQELGSFGSDQSIKELRVAGTHFNAPAVALELGPQVFVPIHDIQGNIVKLINPVNNTIVDTYPTTAFGERQNALSPNAPINPWWYASKRYHPELQLFHFGTRFYDPALGRWLSQDPAGFIDSLNLYQYLLNNPFLTDYRKFLKFSSKTLATVP